MKDEIKVLDHGYVRLVECWGHGDAGRTEVWVNGHLSDVKDDTECGIIEAARQSTQGSFRGWDDKACRECAGRGVIDSGGTHPDGREAVSQCPECKGAGTERGDARLLAYLNNSTPQHVTPIEFAGMIIEVKAPFFVVREWQRSRTHSVTDDEFSGDWAFNELSARYAPVPDENYVPTVERLMRNSKTNKQAGVIPGAGLLHPGDAEEFQNDLVVMYGRQHEFYEKWLNRGVPKELARIDLPVGRYTRMRVTAYLRNWLGFCLLRSDPAAQEEIREYSRAVESILKVQFPRTYALFAARRGAV